MKRWLTCDSVLSTVFPVHGRSKRASFYLLSTFLLYLLLPFPCLSADTVEASDRLREVSVRSTHHLVQQKASDTLIIVTLNIAHGRRTSWNQIFVRTDQTKDNLEKIAAFLKETKADIVALQEADGPSWWSGNFHHVAYLAQNGNYPHYIHESHSHIWIGHYGTGILSRLPMRQGFALTFPPSPPTTRKGYTLAEIEWQTEDRTVIVDVVSVHLDFSRSSVRKEQLGMLQATLSNRKHPLILMGDFNSEWIANQLMQEKSLENGSLHTFFDSGRDLTTYKSKRLDWILISKTFTIDTYDVSPQKLSDHLAVVAKIRLATETTTVETVE